MLTELQFSREYQQNYKALVNRAFKWTRDSILAEDTVQEGALQAWRDRHQYDPEKATFIKWVTQIAFRCFCDGRKKFSNKFETTQTEEFWYNFDTPSLPNQRRLIEISDVLKSSEMLTDPQRTAVLMTALGYESEEIAKVVGTSTGAVRTLLFRGRQALKEEPWKTSTDVRRPLRWKEAA